VAIDGHLAFQASLQPSAAVPGRRAPAGPNHPSGCWGAAAEELGLQIAWKRCRAHLAGVLPRWHGRWGMRRGAFREHGLPHQLLVLTDLSQALREEERLAGSACCACSARAE